MRFGVLGSSLLCAAIMSGVAPSGYAQTFYLHDGDRVAFYGDSITAQRLYTQQIEAFVDTRYPRLHVEFHNAGVPGDRVTGGYAGDATVRVARDVAPFDPTVITVMLGMNEGGYTSFSPEVIPPFETGYKTLIHLIKKAAPAARLNLLENTPYDEITHGTEFTGYMNTTKRIAASIPAFGASEQIPVIDTEGPMEKLLKAAAKAQPVLAQLLIPDRIHPAEAAHWVIAAAVLRAWNADPVVSSVTLNAADLKVESFRKTTVSSLSSAGDGLDWDQQDEALPLPLNLNDPLMRMVLELTDLASLDEETLTITHLSPGAYTITIDHSKVLGPFTAEQLSEGINLAAKDTPMLHQARAVSAALDSRSKLEQAEFSLRADTAANGKTAASEALADGEREFTSKARANLSIPLRHYSVRRATQPK